MAARGSYHSNELGAPPVEVWPPDREEQELEQARKAAATPKKKPGGTSERLRPAKRPRQG